MSYRSLRVGVLDVLPFLLLATGIIVSARFYDEDALIIFRFARNLAQHGVLAFNVSDPTYSLTCPAWGIVVGASAALLGMAEHARALAIVLAAACSLVFLGQIRRVFEDLPGPWRAAALSIVALDPYLVWCAAVGNELPAFLVLLMLIFHAARQSDRRPWKWTRIGFLIGIAYLFRPEAFLLVPVIAVWRALHVRRGAIRPALHVACSAAGTVLPWLVFAQIEYGQLVPLTIEAKAEVEGVNWWRPLRFLVLTGGKAYAFTLLALFAGILSTSSRTDFVRRWSLELLWVASVLVLYVAGLRETIAANRYLVVFAPIVTLVALASVRQALGGFAHPRTMRLAMGCWIVASGAIALAAFESRIDRMRAYAPYVLVSRWMQEHLPENARVFTPQLGAPGWYTTLHLVDNGIVSREGLGLRRGEMTLEELWTKLRADYAVVTTSRAGEEGLYVLHREEDGRGAVFEVVALSPEAAARVRVDE